MRPPYTMEQIERLSESSRLRAESREMLYEYYNNPELKQSHISDKYGLTPARMSQIIYRFEVALQEKIKEEGLTPFIGFYKPRDLLAVERLDFFAPEDELEENLEAELEG